MKCGSQHGCRIQDLLCFGAHDIREQRCDHLLSKILCRRKTLAGPHLTLTTRGWASTTRESLPFCSASVARSCVVGQNSNGSKKTTNTSLFPAVHQHLPPATPSKNNYNENVGKGNDPIWLNQRLAECRSVGSVEHYVCGRRDLNAVNAVTGLYKLAKLCKLPRGSRHGAHTCAEWELAAKLLERLLAALRSRVEAASCKTGDGGSILTLPGEVNVDALLLNKYERSTSNIKSDVDDVALNIRPLNGRGWANFMWSVAKLSDVCVPPRDSCSLKGEERRGHDERGQQGQIKSDLSFLLRHAIGDFAEFGIFRASKKKMKLKQGGGGGGGGWSKNFEYGAQHVSNFCWGAAVMRASLPDAELQGLLAAHFFGNQDLMASVQQLVARSLDGTGTACRSWRTKPSAIAPTNGRCDADEAFDILHHTPDAFLPQHVANISWALVKSGVPLEKDFVDVVDADVQLRAGTSDASNTARTGTTTRKRSYEPTHVASVLWSLCHGGYEWQSDHRTLATCVGSKLFIGFSDPEILTVLDAMCAFEKDTDREHAEGAKITGMKLSVVQLATEKLSVTQHNVLHALRSMAILLGAPTVAGRMADLGQDELCTAAKHFLCRPVVLEVLQAFAVNLQSETATTRKGEGREGEGLRLNAMSAIGAHVVEAHQQHKSFSEALDTAWAISRLGVDESETDTFATSSSCVMLGQLAEDLAESAIMLRRASSCTSTSSSCKWSDADDPREYLPGLNVKRLAETTMSLLRLQASGTSRSGRTGASASSLVLQKLVGQSFVCSCMSSADQIRFLKELFERHSDSAERGERTAAASGVVVGRLVRVILTGLLRRAEVQLCGAARSSSSATSVQGSSFVLVRHKRELCNFLHLVAAVCRHRQKTSSLEVDPVLVKELSDLVRKMLDAPPAAGSALSSELNKGNSESVSVLSALDEVELVNFACAVLALLPDEIVFDPSTNFVGQVEDAVLRSMKCLDASKSEKTTWYRISVGRLLQSLAERQVSADQMPRLFAKVTRDIASESVAGTSTEDGSLLATFIWARHRCDNYFHRRCFDAVAQGEAAFMRFTFSPMELLHMCFSYICCFHVPPTEVLRRFGSASLTSSSNSVATASMLNVIAAAFRDQVVCSQSLTLSAAARPGPGGGGTQKERAQAQATSDAEEARPRSWHTISTTDSDFHRDVATAVRNVCKQVRRVHVEHVTPFPGQLPIDILITK